MAKVAEPTAEAPVIVIVPIDLGDAHGAGNPGQRQIDPSIRAKDGEGNLLVDQTFAAINRGLLDRALDR